MATSNPFVCHSSPPGSIPNQSTSHPNNSTLNVSASRITSPLLRLPLELRLSIYQYLFTFNSTKTFKTPKSKSRLSRRPFPDHIQAPCCFRCGNFGFCSCFRGSPLHPFTVDANFHAWNEETWSWEGCSSPALLRICRQLNAEVQNFLFRRATIDVNISTSGIFILSRPTDARNTRPELKAVSSMALTMHNIRNFPFGILEHVNLNVEAYSWRGVGHVLLLRHIARVFADAVESSVGDGRLPSFGVCWTDGAWLRRGGVGVPSLLVLGPSAKVASKIVTEPLEWLVTKAERDAARLGKVVGSKYNEEK